MNPYFPMNEYIIYTTEGETIAPNGEVDVDNCQVIGSFAADSPLHAVEAAMAVEQWVGEAGFDPGEFIVKQLLTESQRGDITVLVNYLATLQTARALPATVAAAVARLQQL